MNLVCATMSLVAMAWACIGYIGNSLIYRNPLVSINCIKYSCIMAWTRGPPFINNKTSRKIHQFEWASSFGVYRVCGWFLFFFSFGRQSDRSIYLKHHRWWWTPFTGTLGSWHSTNRHTPFSTKRVCIVDAITEINHWYTTYTCIHTYIITYIIELIIFKWCPCCNATVLRDHSVICPFRLFVWCACAHFFLLFLFFFLW